MRAKALSVILLSICISVRGQPAEKHASPTTSPVFTLPVSGDTAADTEFSAAQIAFVQSWIRQKAPECPAEISPAVAQQFLEELQLHHPGKLDQLTSPNFPSGEFEPALLRDVATKMTGNNYQPAREEIARRRITAVLTAGRHDAPTSVVDAAALLKKIRDESPTQYRRLVDGKMDDDDLHIELKKASQVGVAKKEMEPANPKMMTASEIVAEFSRRNQVGSALEHLQAYIVEGRIKTASGEEQQILLFRMRPDRFRLVVRVGGVTRYILAGRGGRFWQQLPGKAPQVVAIEALGQQRYLSEFFDPLFAGDSFSFEKLDDGAADGKKYYRIRVSRADHSTYVARIDRESFWEVGRENEDHSTARYSDFREIGGVIYSFHEELTDKAGTRDGFELTGISPNPGLIGDIFELPSRSDFGYFALENCLAPAPVAALKFH